jgi:hypothetical protein
MLYTLIQCFKFGVREGVKIDGRKEGWGWAQGRPIMMAPDQATAGSLRDAVLVAQAGGQGKGYYKTENW